MTSRQTLLRILLLPLVGCGLEVDEDAEFGQAAEAVTIVDQTYQIKSVSSGKCTAVNGASQTSGAGVVQLTCDGGASQSWQLKRLAGGTYEVKALHSNQCLAVATNSSQNGQKVVQSACNGAGNQKWLLADSSGALLFKPQTSGANNRKCMDVTGSSTANLAALIQWDCKGTPSQRWTLLPVAAPGGGGTTTPANGTKVTYAIDNTTIFANPERGFYHHQETDGTSPVIQSELSGFRTNESVSLILRQFYLNSFRSSSISASYLAGISTDFDRIRAAGLKTVLRFAYTASMTKPYGDASLATVLGHIAQLKPLLQANADIIATVQVGFIGAWGEWYYTDFFGDEGNISATQWDDRKAVLDALLAALPSTRTVQLRYVPIKQRFYGATALTSAEAFGGTAKARVGHHNDCFLAAADDFGTYGNVAADKAYLNIENLYLPQGGETCVTSSFSGWANANADMEKLRYSFLNRDYNDSVLSSWGSNLDIARRRLGYRLALTDATFDGSASPGGELKANLGVRNDGYAPPFNPRGLEIIARHQTTGARLFAKLPVDARRFTPATTQRIDARLCVPMGTPEGTYTLSLALPDPETALRGRPEYAIRLANTGLWDAASGSNSFKQSITVAASTVSVPCSEGSVPLTP